MKNRFTLSFALGLFFIGLGGNLFAQTPPPGTTGEALKAWLRTNYYDGLHTTLGYSTARMYMYNYIDNKNNTITDVYGGYVQPWTYGGTGTNPAPINAEHTVPQSFFGSSEPMQSDIHHLFPCYGNWNSTRSNYPFADINDNSTAKWMYLDQSQTTIPSSNIDAYSEYASSQFEPREEQKGNTARAIFYFYTMYPTQAGNMSSVGDINTLFQWHLQDPPDADEIQRNQDIETYQGNKNPYVEHPEWVADAWNLSASAPNAPTNVQLAASGSSLNLSWSASSGATNYEVYRSTDNVNFSLLVTLSSGSTSYSDGSVAIGTTYYYYLIATNASGSSSASATVSGAATGSSGGGDATDLFISEYIEGSSYNKALEIANFTGAAVDMSAYTLKKETNGGGSWGSDYPLTGTLADGDVWVIAHSSADAAIQAQADVSTGAGIVTFNGNDVIGLFKGTTLIDILGTFGSSANYAQDQTLVRKADIGSPNATYTTSEWDFYASNTFSDIGIHTFNGGSSIDPPAAVSNFALTATTSSLDLTWDDLADEDGYYLFRSTDNVNFTQIASPVAGTTSYSDNSVTLETTYYYYIEGYNAGGTGAASSTVNGATLPLPPDAPENLELIATTIDLNLMWDDLTNENGYYVYRSTDNVNFSQIASLGADNTSYTDNTVQLLSTYYYYVVAHNAGGNSGNSNTVSGATESTGGNATDLIISEYIEGSSFNKAIEIANFTGSTVDLSDYTLKKETNGAGGWASDYVLSGTLAHGDVWVIANSAASATILAQADVSTGSAIVTFNGNDALGLFKNGTLIDMLGTLGSSANYAQDVTLVRKSSINSPSATYVTSQWDSYSTDEFSYLGSHTMDGTATPPDAPANLAITETETSLDLTWDDVTDEDGYYVYRSADNVNFSQIASLGVDATSYSDNSMSLETLYYYYVVAYNAAGNSGNSNTVSGQTVPVATGASELFISEYIEGSSSNRAIEIANFTGAAVSLSGYSLRKQLNGGGSWQNDTPLSGTLSDSDVYVVAHSSASSSITNVADLTTSSNVMTFTGNDPIGLFKNGTLIDIVGTYNCGSGNFGRNTTLVRKSTVTDPNTNYTPSEWDAYSNNTFSFLGSHTYGPAARVVVNQSEEIAIAKAYPNPFDQLLTVKYDLVNEGTVKISLINLVGQEVKMIQEKTNQLSGEQVIKVETSDLAPGMYMLRIETETESKIIRVVKQ